MPLLFRRFNALVLQTALAARFLQEVLCSLWFSLFFCFQRSQLPLQQIVAGIKPLLLKTVPLLPNAKKFVNQFCSAPSHIVLAMFRLCWIVSHKRLRVLRRTVLIPALHGFRRSRPIFFVVRVGFCIFQNGCVSNSFAG